MSVNLEGGVCVCVCMHACECARAEFFLFVLGGSPHALSKDCEFCCLLCP